MDEEDAPCHATNHISNSAILSNNNVSLLSDLCTCTNEMVLLMKSKFSVTGLNHPVRLQICEKVIGELYMPA